MTDEIQTTIKELPKDAIIIDRPNKEFVFLLPAKKNVKEAELVERKLNPTCKRLYYLFKRATKNGSIQIAVKDEVIIKAISCTYRTLYTNRKLLEHFQILHIEKISHGGRSIRFPRKLYSFKELQDEEQSK